MEQFKATTSDYLWYDEEAQYFEEALPLGNGKLGALVYGGAKSLRIGLNHDELWTGLPCDGLNGVTKESFFEARDLALEGRFVECNKVLDEKFCRCARVNAYMPLGDLYVDADFSDISDYKRFLYLNTAISREEFKADGAFVQRECFISYKDNCLVWHGQSDKPLSFKVRLTTQLQGTAKAEGDEIALTGVTPIHAPQQIAYKAWGEGVEGEHGMRFCALVRVITDGALSASEDGIEIKDATDTKIIFVAETSYNGYNTNPLTHGKDELGLTRRYLDSALKKSYEAIREAHISDVFGLYNSVHFDLGQEENYSATDERIRLFDGGRGERDDGLIVLLFNYGRYLTIAGSRRGSQPLNLQGIWNDLTAPPWESDFHTNINLQMNYFPTLRLGYYEMTEPLEELIRMIGDKGRKTAQQLYGARGFVCHHNTDVYGLTGPIYGYAMWAFFYLGSGWLLRHLYEKFKFTRDMEYLRNAYPLLRDGSAFYLDILCEMDGYLAPCPASSPENSVFVGDKRVDIAKSSTMAVSIIRELFTNTLEAAELLSIEDEITAEIKEKLPRLLPMRILSDGRLEEFYFGEGIEYPECEPTHRHVSHLYAVYPACEELDESLIDAVKRTLEARGDESTGWSLAWRICLFARLYDGNRSLKFIKRLLTLTSNVESVNYRGKSGVYANLFDAHPPFQIDGNFGFVAGVLEMLMQERNGEIVPLPALPDEWQNGSIRGIKAYGDKTVDIAWKNGKLTEFNVR